ncbi:MAG: M20/M25/M40 family metallo-hydrolase [Chloroflexota bacterium]|nr:M20/M25/M40 family metallo-hydrolase [Chloroflexota bacterium]
MTSEKQKPLLIIAWILLTAWAMGLGYWWFQQNERIDEITRTPGEISTTSSASSGELVPADATGNGQGQTAALAESTGMAGQPSTANTLNIGTTPLLREPGNAAREGDHEALAEAFSAEQAMERIGILAAPPFDGRRPGTAGGSAAAEYIADAFSRYDLQPAGDLTRDGERSFFQEFPLDYFIGYTTPPVLEIFDPNGEALGPYEFRTDYSSFVRDYAGQGEAEGPLVWANYCRHADFDQVDAVDTIVLCRQGGAEDVTRNAIEHGAAGLLLIGAPDERPIDRIGRYRIPLVPVPLPAFIIEPALVHDLLAGSDLTLEDLTIQAQGTPLQTHAHLQVELEEKTGAIARNVLGIIPGSDPDFAGQVVMVGGHFDHLGDDPDGLLCTRENIDGDEICRRVDGAVYWGANDNASGIATLLEIARDWQEQGFVPRRSVVFAAWDAEEQGLWGSSYFVENPTLPLSRTVAYLNLDMVGAGSDTLAVDGTGPVADQFIALATSKGISATLEDGGRSDHVPFRAAGVDASMIIWFADYAADDPGLAHYHRPIDQINVIDPDKLQAAGELAQLALFSFASVEPELEQLLDQQRTAIDQRDMDAFLDTFEADRRSLAASWWLDLSVAPPEHLDILLANPIVVGDVATGTLRYEMRSPDRDVVRRFSGPTLFSRETGRWLLDGPALEATANPSLILHHAYQPDRFVDEVLEMAGNNYEAVRERMGISRQAPPGDFYLHPTRERLQVAAGLNLPNSVETWVVDNNVHLIASSQITRTETLTTVVTQLALAQLGLQEETAPWLWHGLPLHFASSAGRQAQPGQYLASLKAMLEDTVPYQIHDFPSLRDPAGGSSAWQAVAWATTGFLLQEYGEEIVPELARALAESNDPRLAFQQVLGRSPSDFDQAWQAQWRDRLQRADRQIAELMNRRSQAISEGNQALFMSTVATADPALLSEEATWFTALLDEANRPDDLELTARLDGLTADGALAAISATWQEDGEPKRATFQAVFPEQENRLQYGGPQWLSTAGDLVTLRYRHSNRDLAEALLPQIEQAHALIGEILGLPAAPVVVNLYNNDREFALASGFTAPEALKTWTGNGQSIRVLAEAGDRASDVQDVRNRLLDSLVEQLLLQAGISSSAETQWLRTGLGRLALQWVTPRTGWQQAGSLSGKAAKAAQRDNLWPLAELPLPASLAISERALARAQGWDATRYLLNTYGRQGLDDLLTRLSESTSLIDAIPAALGLSLADFEQAWKESSAAYHIPADWVTLARAFDGERAMGSIETLDSEQYQGREIGTEGGRLAGDSIAAQFQQLGLAPGGADGSYFQTFAISRTQPAATPVLALHRNGESLPLVYREDFMEFTQGNGLGGDVREQVVWVRDSDYTNMNLGGKVALRKPSEALDEEVRRAAEAGAGALILANDIGPNELRSRRPVDLSQTISPTLPVMQLTKDAFEALLGFGEITLRDLNTAPEVLRLDLEAEALVPLGEPQEQQGRNVLALWPGSNPELADEVVVLSAHYDGAGMGPDGTLYSSANDNASGVSVLLEVARTWKQQGMEPSRSVLFAAWDGDELDQRGSTVYVAQPTLPLSQTLGVINLDSIAGGQGFFPTFEGDRRRESLLHWALSASSDALGIRADVRSSKDEGDHTPFQTMDVPAVLMIWDGADDDINSVRDRAKSLDIAKLQRSGEIVALTLRWLTQ